MNPKINISRIVSEHLETLKDGGNEHTSKYDLLTFYGVPLLVSVLFYALSAPLAQSDAININGILVSAFSIFAALLLNVQVLIIGLKERLSKTQAAYKGSPEDITLAKRIAAERTIPLTELFANVSYAIFVALLVVTFTLFALFAGIAGSKFVAAIEFFGITHFALTSLMVLKRMHVLFGNN